MSLWQIVYREIQYRKMGFAIGLLCIVVAIATMVGATTLLRSDRMLTEQLLAERESQTRAAMDRLEDDYRVIMRDLGYNVVILHQDQSLSALRTVGWPDTLLPQEYAEMLGHGQIETLNHLFPVLQKGIVWPEYGIEVIVSGTPGQVPVQHKSQFLTADGTAYRNPIRPVIPPGEMELGHGVARELNLRRGDEVTFDGRPFRVSNVRPPEGDADDAAVWMDLDSAQAILNLPGQINAILALECVCPDENIGAITAEVSGILPDAQVLEFSSRVAARARARQRAESAAHEAIAAELEHRQAVAAGRRALALVLVPLVLGAAGLWVFFTVLANVREREAEIGILRAMGVGRMQIASVFLIKAVLAGLGGALIGYAVGVLAGGLWAGVEVFSAQSLTLFDPALAVIAIVVAVTLSALAAWAPAIAAAGRDPAVILREANT